MIDLPGSIYEQRHSQSACGMVKTASDVDRYRHIIAAVQPKLIVECGTYSMVSAVFFATEAGCRVVTIDVDPGPPSDETREAARAAGVIALTGSSTDSLIIDQVKAIAGNFARSDPVMVVLDSDHSAAHVAAEMAAYGPLVTPRSYMVVEDGITRWLPEQLKPLGPYTGSPLDAIESWMHGHPGDWEIDTDIEDLYPTTQFPAGFLRRLGR